MSLPPSGSSQMTGDLPLPDEFIVLLELAGEEELLCLAGRVELALLYRVPWKSTLRCSEEACITLLKRVATILEQACAARGMGRYLALLKEWVAQEPPEFFSEDLLQQTVRQLLPDAPGPWL